MTEHDCPLVGRRALVTGAATGIGSAAVRGLPGAGAAGVATHHRAAPPEDFPAHWCPCDVRSVNDVDRTARHAVDNHGGFDVPINAAGQWLPGILGVITTGNIDDQLATNPTSAILTNHAAYAAMT